MCVHVCERERSKRLDEQQQTPASAYEKGFFHLKSFFLSTAKVKSHITEIKPINTNTSIERLSLSRFLASKRQARRAAFPFSPIDKCCFCFSSLMEIGCILLCFMYLARFYFYGDKFVFSFFAFYTAFLQIQAPWQFLSISLLHILLHPPHDEPFMCGWLRRPFKVDL